EAARAPGASSSSLRRKPPSRLRELRAGNSEPRVDRVDRDAQRFRNFVRRVVVDIVQHEHRAAIQIDLLQYRYRDLASLTRNEAILRGYRSPGHIDVGRHPFEAVAWPSPVFGGNAVRKPGKPRSHRPRPVERGESLFHPQKELMSFVFEIAIGDTEATQ